MAKESNPINKPTEGNEGRWSGFIEEDRISNQGAQPYDGKDLNWPTRSGMQKK